MSAQFSSAEDAAIASFKHNAERWTKGSVVFPVLDGEVLRHPYTKIGGAKNSMRLSFKNLTAYCGHNSVNGDLLYEKLVASGRLTFLTVKPTLP